MPFGDAERPAVERRGPVPRLPGHQRDGRHAAPLRAAARRDHRPGGIHEVDAVRLDRGDAGEEGGDRALADVAGARLRVVALEAVARVGLDEARGEIGANREALLELPSAVALCGVDLIGDQPDRQHPDDESEREGHPAAGSQTLRGGKK
jgi:hypothetical protein